MPSDAPPITDYQTFTRTWEQGSSWHRRLSARLGLQGKLISGFLILLMISLGASCWTFAVQNKARLADLMGEHTRQLSAAIAMSSEGAVRNGHWDKLRSMGEDLVRGRDVLFVGFLDADAKPVALASREPEFKLGGLKQLQQDSRSLTQVQKETSPVFGDYFEVVTPIVSRNPEHGDLTPFVAAPNLSNNARLLGYVVVGVSQQREQAQLSAINYVGSALGLIAILISLPLTSWLVHRIFLPIRELGAATQKIIDGDLDTYVPVHRPDVIGDLARSFNEMVQWVKKQRQDVAAANNKLFEANRDLEVKIDQRTAQLETANKRLSSEIAEKEDFLRAVSHDLNAPLRNISGMATMLLMKHKDAFQEDVINRLERIKKNVDVETDLISELLELSRIKTRRQKMEMLNLEAMIWELRGVFENDLKSHEIELIIDSCLPTLKCERARIRQVFQNLIDNAIKYMGTDKEKREIHIGCTMKLTEAEFYVRDTGMGIDPEDIEKVFFVFRRGKNTASQNIAGKGVGLASVKSIIETYNGTIWVESKLGEGSKFLFTINGLHLPLGGGADGNNEGANSTETAVAA